MTSPRRAKFDLVALGRAPAGASGVAAGGLPGKTVALVEQADMVGGAGINRRVARVKGRLHS